MKPFRRTLTMDQSAAFVTSASTIPKACQSTKIRIRLRLSVASAVPCSA